MKRIYLVLSIIIVFPFLFLSGCNNFDEDKAVEDTKKQLDSLFETYEDMEVIIKTNEKKELKNIVNEKFNSYFTERYLEKANNEIDKMEMDISSNKLDDPIVFFLQDSSWEENFIIKFNKYRISDEKRFVPDSNEKVVRTKLVGTGHPTHMFIEVTLKKEGETMKIDHAEKR